MLAMAIGHNTTAGSQVGKRTTASRRSGRARFDEEDIARTFDSARLAAGRILAAGGAVTTENVLRTPEIRATVTDGTNRRFVTLEILEHRDSSLLTVTCSCRTIACAHGAAAALALLELFPTLRRPSQASFIDRLLEPSTDRSTEQHRIVYSLETSERNDTFYVMVATEISDRNSRRIEGSSPKRAAVAAPIGPTGDADRTVCRLLGLSSLPLVPVPLNDDEAVDDLITALVETGRARWGIHGPGLVRGPTRRFLLETNPRTDVQKFLNRPAKTRIIGDDPAWYVSETTGHIGQAIIDEVTTQSFVPTAPPARPRSRCEVTPTVIDRQPVPVLKAATGPIPTADGMEILLLHFDYGGRLVREDETGQIVRIDGDSGPLFVRRDRRLEESAAAALRALGLTAVRVGTPVARTTAGRGYAFRGRNPKENWQWMVLSGAEDLRRQGWRVELDDTQPFIRNPNPS